MKYLYLLAFLFLFSIKINAQLSGRVTDPSGEPLSFASIYIQGSSIGTTTNIEGNYFFELEKGTYQLVFQYVGFKQKTVTIVIGNQAVVKDVVMLAESFEINEITVVADGEDPAYPIIRKAIAKRKYYLEQVQEYQCNIYIKGGIKLLDAPTKIMGNEIGDMGGSLDTNRQGIVYLSESESILNFRQPDKYKEIMVSSKVSGNDNGWSFNRFSEMDFNLYKNTSLYNRDIISPIANGAMQYYRYKLLGTFYGENGKLVNKIKVTPKRKEDPAYEGTIYINDELWNIQATEIFLTTASMKLSGMDTLWLRQVHVPIQEPDVWRLLSQTISFKAGAFGFKVKGDFTGVFNDYNITPTFEDKMFNNETLFFQEGANEKNLEYWDSIRPIPLTVEEDADYIKKDSLQKIWDTKEYKDSIDRKNNRFKVSSLLFGYTYDNSWKRWTVGFTSPLSTVQFNPVQGLVASIDFFYRKEYDDKGLRWFSLNPKIQYGFADKQYRGKLGFYYNFNKTDFSRLKIDIGKEAVQINEKNPISEIASEWFNLFHKENYMKLYEKQYIKGFFQKEITNGLIFRLASEYANRQPLFNNSDFSWVKDPDKVYEPNRPENINNNIIFRRANSFFLETRFRIRFAQKYLTYPDRKYIMGSKWPDVWLSFRYAHPFKNDFADYSRVTFQITDDYIGLGVAGYSEYNFLTGGVLGKKWETLSFLDFHHFNGNQTYFGNPNRYLRSFKRLPYYEFSTNRPFAEFHYAHHFEGFLFDKIPLIRKLGWQSVVGFNMLRTAKYSTFGITIPSYNYGEISFGIDNIGYKLFRLFRVDVVASFREFKYDSVGVVLGIKL